ncbi:snf2 DNA repair protein, partial [Chrysochromulina tobinii]
MLASADQLSSLTIKPLKALCAAHGIDHGLSGKKKSEHVQRLLTIKKCKGNNGLLGAYLELCKLRMPRIRFEAHSLEGINGATRHTFSNYVEDHVLAAAGEARLVACGLWGRLRSYQREGVLRALRMGGTCLIADEMGLGKSLTALAIVAALDAWPCLAIVPAVCRRGWAEEAERWLGGLLAPSDIHVVYDQFGALEEGRPVPRLVLVSPKMADFTHQHASLARRSWGSCILDEAHACITTNALRAEESDQTKALMQLLKLIPHRLLLTGTPAVAKAFDSFNQVQLLRPGLLGVNKFEFRHRFFDEATGACKLPRQLPLLLHRFVMIRRTKAQ